MDNILNFNSILRSFNIKANCIDYQCIDNYSFYDLTLKPNAKVKDIQKYLDEISLFLKKAGVPRLKVMHDKGVVRLEFSAPRSLKLNLFDFFTNKRIPEGETICLLGQAVDGSKMWMDIANNPHMIISGTTGSGKSTLLHNIIANLLNYNNVDLFLVDPKNIEFAEYDKKIKSIKVSYSYDEAMETLNYLLDLMERRYEQLRAGTPLSELKPVILMIDEFADLIMQDKNDEFYNSLVRLSQKCRAAKIHIILATQRPSVDIINGTIKANFPTRIACKVSSHVDSKVILDATGAQHLLGKGDALIRDSSRYLERFQVAFTTAKEVCSIFGD